MDIGIGEDKQGRVMQLHLIAENFEDQRTIGALVQAIREGIVIELELSDRDIGITFDNFRTTGED